MSALRCMLTSNITSCKTHTRTNTLPVVGDTPRAHFVRGGHSSTRPSLFESDSAGNRVGYSALRVCTCACTLVEQSQ